MEPMHALAVRHRLCRKAIQVGSALHHLIAVGATRGGFVSLIGLVSAACLLSACASREFVHTTLQPETRAANVENEDDQHGWVCFSTDPAGYSKLSDKGDAAGFQWMIVVWADGTVLHAERNAGDIECFYGLGTKESTEAVRKNVDVPELSSTSQDRFYGPGSQLSRMMLYRDGRLDVAKWNEIQHPRWGSNSTDDDEDFEKYRKFVLIWTSARLEIVRMTRFSQNRASAEEIDEVQRRIGCPPSDERFWRPERWPSLQNKPGINEK